MPFFHQKIIIKSFWIFHDFSALYFWFFLFQDTGKSMFDDCKLHLPSSCILSGEFIYFLKKKSNFDFFFWKKLFWDVSKGRNHPKHVHNRIKNDFRRRKNYSPKNLRIKLKKKFILFLSFYFHEKMAENMTFSKWILIFLMFLGIPEAQLLQKQRFWPSGRVF